jgi:hypothetical protein
LFWIYKNIRITDITKIDKYTENKILRDGDDLPQTSINDLLDELKNIKPKTIIFINNDNKMSCIII